MTRKTRRKGRRKRRTKKPGPAQALATYLAKLGRRGGTARAKNLTPEERRSGAQKAAQARWAKRPSNSK